MHRSIAASVAAACLVLAASHAHADTVRLSGFTYGSEPLTVTGPNYTGSAGQFSGTLNGASFVTFCTDLYQTVSFGTTYTDYSLVSGATAWGAQKSLDLDRAFSAFATYSFPNDAVSSAVAQAVVWEIIYETGSSYSFNSGSFHASSTDSATQTELNLINSVFSSLASTPITVHATKLYSPTAQDFVVLTSAVPEPSTYALMFAGLVGIGCFARRRTPRN